MNSEQRLIDIMFEIGLRTKTDKQLHNISNKDYMEWVAEQLRSCGWDTNPCGLSWGVLKK